MGYLPTGAGFLPSTVSPANSALVLWWASPFKFETIPLGANLFLETARTTVKAKNHHDIFCSSSHVVYLARHHLPLGLLGQHQRWAPRPAGFPSQLSPLDTHEESTGIETTQRRSVEGKSSWLSCQLPISTKRKWPAKISVSFPNI